MFRPVLLTSLLLAALLLAACAATPPIEAPISDAARAAPRDLPASFPDWLPLHRDARPGDWAIHYRLGPHGLSERQRRTEVLSRDGDRLVLRQTVDDGRGHPLRVLRLRVDQRGRVLAARTRDGQGPALPLSEGRLQQTRLRRAEPLVLVSGRFAVDRIVVRHGDDGRQTVHYLDPAAPFAEVVSLTTRRRLPLARLNKLLGRIAVPDPGDVQRTPGAADGVIQDGWVLMHWGRGSR